MKKITLTVWFVVLFAFYIAYDRMNAAPAAVVTPSSGNQVAASAAAPAAASAPPESSSTGTTASGSSAGSGTPPPAQKPVGKYRDGTYAGPSVNAYYGSVKVEAVVSGGNVANVKFLEYPNTHAASVYINSQAMPYLTQEAIQSQDANVNIVSGATFTSEAFVQSLSSALAQAKN